MRFDFHAGSQLSELDLVSGVWTLGGGADDGVRIGGLPPAMLRLAVTAASVWVRGAQPLRVGPAPLDADIWRLLLPGESVQLGLHSRLGLSPVPAAGTRELLRAFAVDCRPLPRCAAAALVAVAGPDAGETFPLSGEGGELGRLAEAEVCLTDPAVSRRQLRWIRTAEGHRVEPRPGPNPVRRNGRRLRTPVLLRAGDVLGVGRTLLCYFPPAAVSAGETDPPAPPAAPSTGGAG